MRPRLISTCVARLGGLVVIACIAASPGAEAAVLPTNLLAYWNFDDAGNPTVAPDVSGNGEDATLLGTAVFSADGGGFSGAAGDRALNLGAPGNGAHALVDSAAFLDSAVELNTMAVTFWQFGVNQPANQSSFWFSAPDASGTSAASKPTPPGATAMFISTPAAAAKPRCTASRWPGIPRFSTIAGAISRL